MSTPIDLVSGEPASSTSVPHESSESIDDLVASCAHPHFKLSDSPKTLTPSKKSAFSPARVHPAAAGAGDSRPESDIRQKPLQLSSKLISDIKQLLDDDDCEVGSITSASAGSGADRSVSQSSSEHLRSPISFCDSPKSGHSSRSSSLASGGRSSAFSVTEEDLNKYETAENTEIEKLTGNIVEGLGLEEEWLRQFGTPSRNSEALSGMMTPPPMKGGGRNSTKPWEKYEHEKRVRKSSIAAEAVSIAAAGAGSSDPKPDLHKNKHVTTENDVRTKIKRGCMRNISASVFNPSLNSKLIPITKRCVEIWNSAGKCDPCYLDLSSLGSPIGWDANENGKPTNHVKLQVSLTAHMFPIHPNNIKKGSQILTYTEF